jgi:hypothetical protein
MLPGRKYACHSRISDDFDRSTGQGLPIAERAEAREFLHLENKSFQSAALCHNWTYVQ